MKFWKQESFKTLQRDWYERLKSEGFYDIEVFRGEELKLKQGLRDRISKVTKTKAYVTRIMTEEYYTLLILKIRETEFQNVIHELILTWYSDGERIKTICQRLFELGMPRDRQSVRFIIRRYEMAWGIRDYTDKELHKTPPPPPHIK